MTNFATAAQAEKQRLTDERATLTNTIADAEVKLKNIDVQLKALLQYEKAISGKAPAEPKTSTAKRAKKGAKADEILTLVKGTDGKKASEILEKLSLPETQAAYRTALANMVKKGTLTLKDKVYTAA